MEPKLSTRRQERVLAGRGIHISREDLDYAAGGEDLDEVEDRILV